MKKWTEMLAVGALCAAAACGVCEEAPKPEQKDEQRLELVSAERLTSWANVCICYDKETGVMYMITRQGGAVVMVDADGKPMIYQPEE